MGDKKIKWMTAGIVILLCLILLTPVPQHYKDGGTVTYKALIYEVTSYHSMIGMDSEGTYLTGMTITVFGLKLYDSTRITQESACALRARAAAEHPTAG